MMSSRSSRGLPLILLVGLAMLMALAGTLPVRSAPPPAPLQQSGTVPIFKLVPPTVDEKTVAALARNLSGVGLNNPTAEEQYLGQPRFTIANTTTLSLLTQFGASGGFYATDLSELGRDTARGPLNLGEAELLACQFLLDGFMNGNGFLPGGRQPNLPLATSFNPQSCDFESGKGFGQVQPIQAATVQVANNQPFGATTTISVGLVVQVPVVIPTPNAVAGLTQNGARGLSVGGPGGHISLLFSTTENDNGASLDDQVPGLAAVALPLYGRNLERQGEVPRRSLAELKAEVRAQVRATYGQNATVRGIENVEEFYYFEDAAVQQIILEPVASFAGLEVDLPNGETIILRDIVVPVAAGGPGGLGPSVSIIAPANSSRYTPGAEVTLRGQIEHGTAPYSFEWLLGDETLLDAGNLNQAGQLELKTSSLPVLGRNGVPSDQTVILRITDADGVQREALISLTPSVVPSIYLPLVARDNAAQNGRSLTSAPAAELAQASNYTFGAIGNWDYPPAGSGGSDLPGVIPDVNGFRSGMTSYGYNSRFYWTNANAWEKDWRDCSLGGGDCSYGVDRAAYVYYAGHGGPAGLGMASNKDSTWVSADNARFNSLRWVGFASCQTLRVQGFTDGNEPIRRWFNAFRGAHMLLGFNSNMRDVAFGGRLVDNMRIPRIIGIEFPTLQQSISQAWVNTAFQLNAGKPAYIYARSNSVDPSGNKLPKPGQPMPPRPFPFSSYHWVWWNE